MQEDPTTGVASARRIARLPRQLRCCGRLMALGSLSMGVLLMAHGMHESLVPFPDLPWWWQLGVVLTYTILALGCWLCVLVCDWMAAMLERSS